MSSTPSRRAILAGASAIAATTVLPASAAAIDPDRELLDLIDRYRRTPVGRKMLATLK